jgi:hypothetical protein
LLRNLATCCKGSTGAIIQIGRSQTAGARRRTNPRCHRR